jgi:hypothetical protein
MEHLTEGQSDLAEAVERAADVLNTLIVIATGRGMCVSLRVVGGTQSKGAGYYEVGRGLEDCREEGAPQMQLRALAFRIGRAGPS